MIKLTAGSGGIIFLNNSFKINLKNTFMKKIIFAVLLLGLAYAAPAQDKEDKGVKKAAKSVGNKTAEIASKGAARVGDEKLKDRQGPNGERIYMDEHSRYYWIDKKGHKQYVAEDQLKPRVTETDVKVKDGKIKNK
jgi:hypothetical protein